MSRHWDPRFPMIGPQARKQSSAMHLRGVDSQNKTNQTKQEARHWWTCMGGKSRTASHN